MRLLPYFQLFHAEMIVCWPGSDLAGIAVQIIMVIDRSSCNKILSLPHIDQTRFVGLLAE